ncbi:BTB and MATH domain-containing protein 42-like [Argiope bruennichi]|uniref:TD and POZ domain-containing protein 1 n=1 Tax=Argiope bruennichi TaxID=94029 RepID=A0A8T0EC47_ARGBR|nr:BTB and MATH domain-containing protein 42-like [Argiope bruennichi]XP_055951394.1 BTB and MATH domain-containing protein 42-like [Argiope bruennichi]KAF8770279.1 TD and POZ domain-containing protein 1 [Argiope bruennichi]
MANEKKCFTFIWKIENASYCSQKIGKFVDSPRFVVSEMKGTQWLLRLYPVFNGTVFLLNCLTFALIKLSVRKEAKTTGIEWQIDLLASNGTVLLSCNRKKDDLGTNELDVYSDVTYGRSEVFDTKKSEYLPQGTLTVRCRIWKKDGEFSENIQWTGRTCLVVKTRSFLWEVGNFRNLESKEKHTYEIKSFETDENLISLDLFPNAEEINFAVTPINKEIKTCKLELFPVNTSGSTFDHQKDEFDFDVPGGSNQSSICLKKSELMEKSDVLSLWCVCNFSTGTILEEIESVCISTICFENSETKNHCLDADNNFKDALIDDFKSMLNDAILSDVKLKTRNNSYPAHKCILGSRSPVFKAMFSSDMKERIKDSVEVEDLSEDTVSRMLRYIYSAEVGELEWAAATQLYEAADKYEILTLRDACSSYLKKNLCLNNACEALVLADLHQDGNLKSFVQDFILRHGKDIINSEEWEHLMETNVKLAAETMRLKYKE